MSGDKSNTNGVLSRDAFFAACKARAITTVDIDGLGRMNIRKLTLGQIKAFDEATDNYERAKMLIQHCVVDGSSKPMFESLAEVDDLEMPVFKMLSEAVSEVNALKAGEKEVKN